MDDNIKNEYKEIFLADQLNKVGTVS